MEKRRYGDMEIWRYGDIEILEVRWEMVVEATKVTTVECGNDWSSGRRWCGDGDMEIWRYGDMEIWRYGDMEIWRYGDMEILEVRVVDGSGSDEGDDCRVWQRLE
jgi:hypothetical protein